MADALEQRLQELQASRAEVRQLAEVVERAHESIVICAADGTVQYANRAAAMLYSVRPGQRLDPALAQLLAGAAHLAHAPREPITLALSQPSGARARVEVSSFALMDAGGRAVAVASIGRDVTERERLEAQLLHAQKLESVGRLAGGIAHDFNNLLTVISGYAELALDALPPGAPQLAEIEEIRKATSQAQRLTGQLLSFARKQPVQAQVLDVSRLLGSMELLLRRLVGETVTLTIRADPAALPVRGDPGQLEQVLVNLVANARDATPDGGRVAVTAGVVRVDADDGALGQELPPGPYVQLVVADTGGGIDPSIRSHLFEPFFTTKPTGAGTGLGLAICHGIVHQHHGTILVDSAVGGGTRMCVLLPLAAEGAAEPPPAARPALPAGTETVLVVEDVPAVREMVVRALREHGYTVLEAANGVEALARLGAHQAPIHLVVSDVVMPELGGLALAEQMRARFPAARVLLMSGYVDKLDQAERLAPPAPILHKPFTPRQLLQAVRAALDLGETAADGAE